MTAATLIRYFTSSNEYKILKELGEGSFGPVYLVQSLANPSFSCVVKQINLKRIISRLEMPSEKDAMRKLVQAEGDKMRRAEHPNIVRVFSCFLEGDFFYISMELCGGSTLKQAIRHRQNVQLAFDERQILLWTAQLVLTLQFLHNQNILHRDIKSENIFIVAGSNNHLIKLGDFGIAKTIDNCFSVSNNFFGTATHIPPEMWHGKPYTRESEAWVLGVVLYELCTLRLPFEANIAGVAALFQQICKFPVKPLPSNYSPELRSLIQDKLLERDFTKRPSMMYVIREPHISPAIVDLLPIMSGYNTPEIKPTTAPRSPSRPNPPVLAVNIPALVVTEGSSSSSSSSSSDGEEEGPAATASVEIVETPAIVKYQPLPTITRPVIISMVTPIARKIQTNRPSSGPVVKNSNDFVIAGLQLHNIAPGVVRPLSSPPQQQQQQQQRQNVVAPLVPSADPPEQFVFTSYYRKWNQKGQILFQNPPSDMVAILTCSSDVAAILVVCKAGHVIALQNDEPDKVAWQNKIALREKEAIFHAAYDTTNHFVYFNLFNEETSRICYVTRRSLQTSSTPSQAGIRYGVVISEKQSEKRNFKGIYVDSKRRLLYACCDDDFVTHRRDITIWRLVDQFDSSSSVLIATLSFSSPKAPHHNLNINPMFCSCFIVKKHNQISDVYARLANKLKFSAGSGEEILVLAISDWSNSRVELLATRSKSIDEIITAKNGTTTGFGDNIGQFFIHAALIASNNDPANKDEEFRRKLGSVCMPLELFFDPVGNLFVTDVSNNRIQIFSFDTGGTAPLMRAVWASRSNFGHVTWRAAVVISPKTGKPMALCINDWKIISNYE